MGIVLIVAGLVLALVIVVVVWFLVAIYRAVDSIPPRVLRMLEAGRAPQDAKAVKALQDATTARVAAITAALRAHEEQMAARASAQLVDLQARARKAESGASEIATTLAAASTLVRDLRMALDGLGRLEALRPVTAQPAPEAATSEDPERPTTEMPRPPAAGGDEPDEDENEMTRVGPRPPVSPAPASAEASIDAGGSR